MMKIAILNDTHIGYKNSSDIYFDYQRKFFENVFFPFCKKEGVDTIIHLGDIFDHRKHISVKSLNFVRTYLLNKIRKEKMCMHIIPGNHDTHFKNSLELCSMFEILQHYDDCVQIYMEPSLIELGGTKIGLVPWINGENQEECINFIKNSPASILGGHFEIEGFRYIANSNMKSEGFSKNLFDRYDMVLSGHYHTKSSHGNITYLGSQYQFNWSDVDDRKYFHILDLSTRELIPIENPHKLYTRYHYDDTEVETVQDIIDSDPKKYSEERIKDNYVRVVVVNKKDYHLFDSFIQTIKNLSPFDLQIVENFSHEILDNDSNNNGDDNDISSIEDTSTLLLEFVDKHVTTNLDKKVLKKYLNELYTEALVHDTV